MQNKQAFTLIELLVVVLIIGILAAVAVPQYQKSVVKSRVGAMLPIMASLAQAQETYYMENGEYTNNGHLLDIEIGDTCTDVQDGRYWKCGNSFLLAVNLGQIMASYCPDHNTSIDDCKSNRYFQIGFGGAFSNPGSIYPAPNSKRCWKPNNALSNFGEEICKSLGTSVPGTDTYELH